MRFALTAIAVAGIQHQLSHQLTQPLAVGRQSTQAAQINWNANVAPTAPGHQHYVQPQFSPIHQQNSYLLSLLQQKDAFGRHVLLPPVSHQPPLQVTQPPVQQTNQQQHWSPWDGQQHGQQPASQPMHQQVPSPFVASPAPAVGPSPQHQQQQQYQTPRPQSGGAFNHNNQMYSQVNDNSNSGSSFAEQSPALAPATPGGHAASPMAGQYQQQRYDQHRQVTHHQQPHQPVHQSQSHFQNQMQVHHTPTHLQPQQQPQQQQTPPTHQQQPSQVQQASPVMDAKPYQNALQSSKDAAAELEQLDPQAYYQQFSSLGDRVKSNKRSRAPDTPPSKEKKPSVGSASNNTTPSKSKVSRESFSSPPKKTPKVCHNAMAINKSSVSSFSTSYTSSHSLTSSAAPQLKSQNSSLPAAEKLEAMLDELFDLGKVKGSKKAKRASSDEEESGSDGERKHKKKGAKVNGEASGLDTSQLFDITISDTTLAHFVAVTAKLKRNDHMQNIPVSKLINLLSVLTQQLAVQSSYLKDKRRKSTEEQEDDDEDDDSNITNSPAMMQKFESCCDAACVALYVLSSKGN